MAGFRFLFITAATVDATSITQAQKSVAKRLLHGTRRLQSVDGMQAMQACDDDCEGAMTYMNSMSSRTEQEMASQTQEESTEFMCANIDVLTCMMDSQACAPLMVSDEEPEAGEEPGAGDESGTDIAEGDEEVMVAAMLMMMCGEDGGMAGMMASMMVSPECQAECVGWLDAVTALVEVSMTMEDGTQSRRLNAHSRRLTGHDHGSPSDGPGETDGTGMPEPAVLDPIVCAHEAAFRCYARTDATECIMAGDTEGGMTGDDFSDALSRCAAMDSAATSVSTLGTVLLALLVVCAAS